MNIKKLHTFFTVLLFATAIHAQEANWSFDPYSFQHDMTMYVAIDLDGELVKDLSTMKVGAFCGDECRGILEAKNIDGHAFGYLRLRSNTTSGERIEFKIMSNSTDFEYLCSNAITFQSQGIVGLPSRPYIITAAKNDLYLLGDVNDDGTVDVNDAVTIISYCVSGVPADIDMKLCDVDRNGIIDEQDASSIIEIYLQGK